MADSKTETNTPNYYLFQASCWKDNKQISFWIAAPFISEKAARNWSTKMSKDLQAAQRKQYSGQNKPGIKFVFKRQEDRRHKNTVVITAPGFMSITAIISLATR